MTVAKITTIGKYRVFFWEAQSQQGVSGWVVDAGDVSTLISKHVERAAAIAAAKRYLAGDKRRGIA